MEGHNAAGRVIKILRRMPPNLHPALLFLKFRLMSKR